MQAHRFLAHGLAERAFVLGIENLNRLTLLHFHSLGLFADEYRPFGGDGLILGEGAAALALSAGAPPQKARLKLIAAAANTGGHLVQSDAETQTRLLLSVLAQANLAPSRIAFVKTHGIGTADTAALETALLAQALRSRKLAGIGGREIPLSDDLYCLANHFGFGGSNTASIWQWTS